jgi:hypothetical protein
MKRFGWILLCLTFESISADPLISPTFANDKKITIDNATQIGEEVVKYFRDEKKMDPEQASKASFEWLKRDGLNAGPGCYASSQTGAVSTDPQKPAIPLAETSPNAEACPTLDPAILEAFASPANSPSAPVASAETPNTPKTPAELPPSTTAASGTSPIAKNPTTMNPPTVQTTPTTIPSGNTAAPNVPPSYGPLSPTPSGQVAFENSQSAHTGSQFTSVGYEAPTSSKKTFSDPASEAADPRKYFAATPAIAASNFSIAKDAMDERVANGTLSPVVAEALLARLKPVLETEPNLIKALGTVQDSLKDKTLPPPPALSPSESSRAPTMELASGDAKGVGGLSLLATNTSTSPNGSLSSTSTTIPLARALILASAALLESNASLKPAESGTPMPSKKTGGKADPSLSLKSAGILSSTSAPGNSFFPPLPSKAYLSQDKSIAVENSKKPDKGKIRGIIASILNLFTGSRVTDNSKLRAISSLSGRQEESGSKDVAIALEPLSEPDADLGNDGYNHEFLALGLGTFGTCFAAAVLVSILWYRKRLKRKVG